MNTEHNNGDFLLQKSVIFKFQPFHFPRAEESLSFCCVFSPWNFEGFFLQQKIARYYEAQLPKSKSRLGFRDLRQVLKAAGGLLVVVWKWHMFWPWKWFVSWPLEENGQKQIFCFVFWACYKKSSEAFVLDFLRKEKMMLERHFPRGNVIWLTSSIPGWFVPTSFVWPVGQNFQRTPNTPKLWRPSFSSFKKTSINRGFQVSPFSLHNFLHRRCFFFPGDVGGFFCGGHEIPSNCQALNQHLGLPVPTAVAVRETQEFTWLSRSMI